jgi:hypothetical protein
VSLQTAVAAPFRQRGVTRIAESEFVVALSLDQGWFSPDQAKRLIDVATGEGLLARENGDLVPRFDPGAVSVPEEFVPEERILQERSPFERVLDDLVEAGHDKRDAVAAINGIQQDLAVTVDAAAVVYARRRGMAVGPVADAAVRELREVGE